MKRGMRGYIAITSVIAMFFIITSIIVTSSMAVVLGRNALLEGEYRTRSVYLASSCMSRVILRRAESRGYGGDELWEMEGGVCKVSPIAYEHPYIKLRVEAGVGDYKHTQSIKMHYKDFSLHAIHEE